MLANGKIRWISTGHIPNSGRLESEIGLEILSDFSNKSLEGKFANEKFGGFLVTSDLTKGDGSWLVTMGLLDTSG